MNKIVETRVRIEHAQLFERPTDCASPLSLSLWCITPKGFSFSTSINFNLVSRGHFARRHALVKQLLGCQGIGYDEAEAAGFRSLVGRHFLLRMSELRAGVWTIEKARAAEPFAIIEGDAAALEVLMGGAA